MKKTTTIDAAKGTSGEDWARRLQNWFAWSSAAIFALMGLLMLDAASGDKRRMRLLLSPDALFGVSNETLLTIAGIIHLALCGAVLLARDPVTRAGLTGWAGLNYVVYRVGMAWVGVAAPFPCVQLISQKVLYAGSETLDQAWGLSTAYFLAGAATLLAAEWRRWQRRRKEAFIEHWQEVRQAPHAPASPGGRASTRAQTSPEPSGNQGSRGRSPSQGSPTPDFKFSCPSCGQHIRCDAAYAGRQITCPACKKQITVLT